VLAFQTIDDAPADMLGFLDICDEDLIRIGQENVCARQRDPMPRPQGIDQMVHGARDFELCIAVDMPAENADGFSVELERHIRIAADTVRTQLFRPAQQHLSGIGELDFFQMRRDDLDIAVKG